MGEGGPRGVPQSELASFGGSELAPPALPNRKKNANRNFKARPPLQKPSPVGEGGPLAVDEVDFERISATHAISKNSSSVTACAVPPMLFRLTLVCYRLRLLGSANSCAALLAAPKQSLIVLKRLPHRRRLSYRRLGGWMRFYAKTAFDGADSPGGLSLQCDVGAATTVGAFTERPCGKRGRRGEKHPRPTVVTFIISLCKVFCALF